MFKKCTTFLLTIVLLFACTLSSFGAVDTKFKNTKDVNGYWAMFTFENGSYRYFQISPKELTFYYRPTGGSKLVVEYTCPAVLSLSKDKKTINIKYHSAYDDEGEYSTYLLTKNKKGQVQLSSDPKEAPVLIKKFTSLADAIKHNANDPVVIDKIKEEQAAVAEKKARQDAKAKNANSPVSKNNLLMGQYTFTTADGTSHSLEIRPDNLIVVSGGVNDFHLKVSRFELRPAFDGSTYSIYDGKIHYTDASGPVEKDCQLILTAKTQGTISEMGLGDLADLSIYYDKVQMQINLLYEFL